MTELYDSIETDAALAKRFPALLHLCPQPISLSTFESGRFIEVNQAWLDFLGYTRDEVIGKSRSELSIWTSAGDRHRLRTLLQDGKPVRNAPLQCRKKSGEIADILFNCDPVEYGGELCMVSALNDISALKRTERLLQFSEQRFGSIFEAMPCCITITRVADSRFLEVNRACEDLYGYSRAEMIGFSAVDFGLWVDPAERARLVDGLAPGEARAIESKFRRKSGEVIEVHCAATCTKLDGEIVLLTTSMDITDRKRAEGLLKASEERFSRMIEASPQPITVTRLADGTYLHVNPACCERYGYSRDEMIGHTATEIGIWADPATRDRLKARFAAGETVVNLETEVRKKSGEIVEVIFTCTVIELDGEKVLHGTAVDVSERKRSERLRDLSEDRFSRVFRASPNPIAIERRDSGVRVDVNDAWVGVFGYSRAEAIGTASADLGMWVDDTERARLMAQFEEQGGLRQVPLRLRRKSGEIADVLVSMEPIELDGEPHLVSCIDDITERKRAERHIEYLATRDHLTGLPNRLLFADRLRQAITKAERGGTRLALLFIDLDRFKDINDSLGHHIGDRLLMEIAERLRGAIRAGDTLARQGGDEFLVLIDGLEEARGAEPIARKLVEAIDRPVEIDGRALSVSCSVGISVYPDDARDEAALMRNSDMAMYSVKESGRNGHRFYSTEMNARLTERLDLENRLREALERDEFELHYQPKIDLAGGRITGCEALLRWRHPEQGVILPGRFIGIAEDTRLIVPIGAWALQHACGQMRAWLDRGLPVVPMSVNLSVQQFDAGLPNLVAAALAAARLSPALLEIEITETVMMTNSAAHMDIMRRLERLGVGIALDDFGTGYSSLSYLREMNVDSLKIDQSFVRGLPASIGDGTIIAAIIAMAGQLRIKVVAEGVETHAQLEALKRMRCTEGQGYLFSAALPGEQFEQRYLQAA